MFEERLNNISKFLKLEGKFDLILDNPKATINQRIKLMEQKIMMLQKTRII